MVKVIAEPANYWQGDHKLLHQAAYAAAAAGCSMFKVQLYDTGNMGKEWADKRLFYKQSELEVGSLSDIAKTVKTLGMELLITISQIQLLDTALRFSSNIKIASGQFDNELACELMRSNKIKKLVISTGMMETVIPDTPDRCGTLEHIRDFALNSHIPEIVVMHCVSLYPPSESEMNMDRIDGLREFFEDIPNVEIGYSDHAADNLPGIIAVAKGVKYVEIHMAIRGMFGPTSEIASTGEELSTEILNFKKIETMLGNGQLKMQDRELPMKERYSTRWKNRLIIIKGSVLPSGTVVPFERK